MWPPYLSVLADGITPVPTGDPLTSFLLGYGVLGVVAIVLSYVLVKGVFVPSKALEEARLSARADLVAENSRLIAEKVKAESQRDDALRVAQDQLIPLLLSFTAATQSLLPLLQRLVNEREEPHDRDPGRGRR